MSRRLLQKPAFKCKHIVSGDFRKITEERIQQIVNTFVKTLTTQVAIFNDYKG